jgi:hypothetical protein
MTLADMIVNLRANTADFTNKMNSALGTWEQMAGSMIAGGAALTAGVTVPIAGLASAAIGMATTIQGAEIGFGTMLGSAKKAGVFLQELKDFAATTPFEFVDLVKASQRMLALRSSSLGNSG